MRMAYASTARADATTIVALIVDFPDGWALSCPSALLPALLPLCPPTIRVMAWVKPGAVSSHLNPARAWEPLLVWGGRPRTDDDDLQRDWVSVPATRTARSRPDDFCYWVFRMLNLQARDELVALPPYEATVGAAWERFRHQLPLPGVREATQLALPG